MAKLVLCHVAKLSKIKQMWHLQMICSKFAIEVNPFFRPVCHTVKSQRNVFTLKTNIATGLDSISDLFRHGYLELLEHLLLCRWLTYIYVDWEKLKFMVTGR